MINLILIGASTGGTRVVPEILEQLPVVRSAVVVVQHMPEFITQSFARTLSRHCAMPVRIAEDGEVLAAGTVTLVPGGKHAVLVQNARVTLNEGPRVHHVRPSVDVTMRSVVAPQPGRSLVGVLLTGMGKDGADGLVHLRALGARTIAQCEETCAVFGMPRAAIERGAVTDVLSPMEIARVLAEH